MYRIKLIILSLLFSSGATIAYAQQTIDSVRRTDTAVAAPSIDKIEQGNKAEETDKKTDKKKEKKSDKKVKEKKIGKEVVAAAPQPDTKEPDSVTVILKIVKHGKNAPSDTVWARQAVKKKIVKKTPPPKPEPELHIIPGAEAKANADTKDKEDRTMKGPSGQKVYISPKGGRYYFNVNGIRVDLKRDTK